MENKKPIKITAGNWHRLMEHSKNREIGIITAFKGIYSLKENRFRNKQLGIDIRQAGFSYVDIEGGYVENYKIPNAKDVDEESLFVIGDIKNPNKLKNVLIGLGEKYEQDSVLYKPVKGEAILIGTNESEFPGYGNEVSLEKSDEFYSKIYDKKFTFDNDAEDDSKFSLIPQTDDVDMENVFEDEEVYSKLNKTMSNKIKKISADEDAGAIDMVGGDEEPIDEEPMEGDMGGDMGGGDMGGDMGGGMEGDMGGEMGGEPPAPQIDYDKMFLEHTHDLDKAIRDDEDFEIDYSSIV